MEKYSAEIARIVHERLKELGWTYSDLALRLRKHEGLIKKWMVGDYNFSITHISKLEAMLSITLLTISL
jgi:ribosome-binding protein aMBF1 (putative translation factor)